MLPITFENSLSSVIAISSLNISFQVLLTGLRCKLKPRNCNSGFIFYVVIQHVFALFLSVLQPWKGPVFSCLVPHTHTSIELQTLQPSCSPVHG